MRASKKQLGLVLTWLALAAALVSIFGAVPSLAEDPTTVSSSSMIFEGTLTDDGDGSYSGTIAMIDETVDGIGNNETGFDVYARNGAKATYDKAGSGSQDYQCGAVANHDAYNTAGGWGSTYNPDCADYQHYQLTFEDDNWYLEYHSSGVTYANPMSGAMDWTNSYAAETGVGAYYSGTGTPESDGYALDNSCTGTNDGTAAWDMDWSWGSEYIPLAFPGFDVDITNLSGDQYRVTLTPAKAPDGSGVSAPGPVVNENTGESYGTIQAAIDDATAGDTISVAAGTYAEHVTIHKSLTLQGAGAADTTIDVSALTIQNPHVAVEIQNGVNDVTVDGFTIIGIPNAYHADDSVIRCGGSSGTNNGITISNNVINGYVGILFKNGDSLTIQDNDITFNKNAIVVQSGCTNVDMSGNMMTGGTSIDADPYAVYVTSTTGSITGNTIQDVIGPNDRGKGIGGSSNYDLLIDNNLIDNTGYDGISFWSDTHHITISNNTLSNNAQTYTKGGGITIKGDDLSITNNTITGSGHDGVIIDVHTLASARIRINENSISGNTGYGLNVKAAGETVDASANWWGSADPAAASSMVSGDADFTPLVDSSTDTDSGTDGFQPDLSSLTVHTLGAQTGTAGRIQEGIDLVSGSTVNVAAGTYDEALTIGKALTLSGEDPSTTVLKAASMPAIAVSADNVTIQNMEVTHDTRLSEAINVTSSSDLTVDNVDFTNLIGASEGANAYGINVESSFANLTVSNSSFSGIDLDSYERVTGVFVPNDKPASNFVIDNNEFTNVFVGVYLRSSVDGLTVTDNTFGPMDLDDCRAAASGIYIGDGSAGFNIDNVTVDGNTFTSYCRSVYVWNYADGGIINGFDITNNTFENSIYSSAVRFIAGGYGSPTDIAVLKGPVTVDGNSFTQDDIGYSGWLSLVDFRVEREFATSQITVSNNDSTFNGPFTGPTHFAMLRGPITNATIESNVLNGGNTGGTYTDEAPTSGVYVKTDSAWGALSASAVINITGNFIHGFENGVSLFDDQADAYGNLPTGADVDVNDNTITGNTDGVVSGSGEITDAENNWWGDASGPGGEGPGSGDTVSTHVDYDPWLTGVAPGTLQAVIDAASPGDVIQLGPYTYEGGVVIDKAITLQGQEGTIITPGSHGVTVSADDVTIDTITFDGTGCSGTDAGIYVNDGVERLWIRNCEVKNWCDGGVKFAGAITDLKIVDNHVHDNAGYALVFSQAPGGTVQIYGNAFRDNGAGAIYLDSGSLNAEYNEWGDVNGPDAGDFGGSSSGNVDYDPWVFGKLWVEPATQNVRETESATVEIKMDVHHLYGIEFDLTFDETLLQLNAEPTIGSFETGTAGSKCTVTDKATANGSGTIEFYCNRADPDAEYDATDDAILTLTFDAQEFSGTDATSAIDILDDSVRLGAKGGVNIFVDDVTDGEVKVLGTTALDGVVDLQGRDDDSGALVDPGTGSVYGWDPGDDTTDAWGKFSFADMTDDDYTFIIEMERYLDAEATVSVEGDTLTLNTVVLLGGDADDSDTIDVSDGTIIGGAYGTTPGDTHWDEQADINADNTVDILDLVLMGGNYGKSSPVPWTP